MLSAPIGRVIPEALVFRNYMFGDKLTNRHQPMESEKKIMRRSLLALSISVILCSPAFAQNALSDPAAPESAADASIPVTYVGGNARVSLGIDEDGDVQGELLGIFGYDGDSAWLAGLWKGQGASGGVQFDYHWLLTGTREDTIDSPDKVRVGKVFVAGDQNAWHDRKATVGFGMQKGDFFIDGYISAGITGKRFVGQDVDQITNTLTGTENGHDYTQTETINTLIDYFEHPYERGIGVRLGRYFDEPLLRLRGGLDYERGKHGSDQITLSLGLDKYIRNTGWSFSLEGEHLEKNGDFEIDEHDDRGWLLARYEFGKTYRPREPFRNVQVEREVPDESAAAAAAPQVMRNDVKLDAGAFFDFDKYDLRADAVAALDEVIAKLRSSERVSRVTIVGHTDSIGTEAYNQALSELRAASAKTYLVQHGVPADEIDTRGAGELNPDYPNDTRENRQKNRRVDIEFLTVEQTPAPPSPVPATKKIVEWVKEPVPAPAAWIERALRDPAEHKRTVDVYRFARTTTTTERGEKQFANLPPVAVDDTVQLADCAAPVSIPVLANDSDPEHDALTVTQVAGAANGTATINADGSVSFTPTTAACGTPGGDTFTYTIRDSFGATATATVHVLPPAGGGNHPPVAANDAATTPVDTPVSVTVLANDSDPDGDVLSVTAVGTPAHGAATKNADGSVTYTPAAGFTGVDAFTYEVSDGKGGTASATVTVTIGNSGNQPPVAVDDEAIVLKGTGQDIDVLANDSDPDGDKLRVIEVHYAGTMATSVTINPDGTVRYQHVHGTEGPDSFTYTITDDHGHTATATVHVFVRIIQ